MDSIRLIPNLPAFEIHKEENCTVNVYVDGVWHVWNLPCNCEGHHFAVGEDIQSIITKIKSGEKI